MFSFCSDAFMVTKRRNGKREELSEIRKNTEKRMFHIVRKGQFFRFLGDDVPYMLSMKETREGRKRGV